MLRRNQEKVMMFASRVACEGAILGRLSSQPLGVEGGTIIKQDNFVVFPALGYWEIDGKPVSKMQDNNSQIKE